MTEHKIRLLDTNLTEDSIGTVFRERTAKEVVADINSALSNFNYNNFAERFWEDTREDTILLKILGSTKEDLTSLAGLLSTVNFTDYHPDFAKLVIEALWKVKDK